MAACLSVSDKSARVKRAAVASALSLLLECSSDLDQLATHVGSDCETRRAYMVQTVDAADQRADKVSSLARRLLEILASQAATESTPASENGMLLHLHTNRVMPGIRASTSPLTYTMYMQAFHMTGYTACPGSSAQSPLCNT